MERGRARVTPTTAGAGRGLILPEPARSLWLEHRGAVRAMLREAGIRKYALHGGTILAARWRHRASTDIDITYGRRTVGLAAPGLAGGTGVAAADPRDRRNPRDRADPSAIERSLPKHGNAQIES